MGATGSQHTQTLLRYLRVCWRLVIGVNWFLVGVKECTSVVHAYHTTDAGAACQGHLSHRAHRLGFEKSHNDANCVCCVAAAALAFYTLPPQFPYIEAVVRESLRLYPPATLLNRRIKTGASFAITPDIIVPQGVSVFPFLYGYQRSPEYWPAAEEFRPERWLPEGKHLAPTTPEAWTPFGRCVWV